MMFLHVFAAFYDSNGVMDRIMYFTRNYPVFNRNHPVNVTKTHNP